MRFIAVIILSFVFTSGLYSRVLDPPIITCVEVLENGEVTLYWRSLDTDVLEFKIYYSTDQANWLQAGSVDSQNLDVNYTVTDQYVNANERLYYFYITAVYPSTDVDSDIFSSIFLVVDNSTDGVATLLWNPVRTPLPEGSSNLYQIYASIFETGLPAEWKLITDDIENTLYNYIIPNGLCLDSINFKIEIENDYNCSSVSNITGNWFSETIQPEKPVFDSVSIVDNSYVILGWDQSLSEDALGTVIYRYDSGIWVIIDTVTDNTITQYIDSSYLSCDLNNEYAIAAIDSCGILSPGSFSEPLRPILLQNISFDICSATNSINWEPYINASPSLEKYQIWASTGSNNPELIDEIPGTSINYQHTGVESVTEYNYFVRAIFGGSSSTSCIKSITTGSYILPTSIYLANSNVEMDNTIMLTIDPDLIPNACTWNISRSDAGGGNESPLVSIDRSEITTSPYIYHDETADGSQGYYTYTISVSDSCGKYALESNTQKTVFLSGDQISDTENKLLWNKFEGFDAGVEKYYIYRYNDESFPGLIIDSVDSETTEYTDNVDGISTSKSIFNYLVQAVEYDGNIFGFKERSYSNTIQFFRDTELYMPNAFRPSGTNSVFKPVTTGFGGSGYLFQIYNRWGQKIFETNNPDLGWDGTYNGNMSPQGTYIYRLVYNSVFNEANTKQGIVTLID